MAKKKSGLNKSQSIRDYLKTNPSAKPKEIVAAMKAKGVSVSAQFVSTIKTNSKNKTGPSGKRGRPAGSKNKSTVTAARATRSRSSASRVMGETVSVESLLMLKKVVEDLGSIDEAKAALNTLEKLSS